MAHGHNDQSAIGMPKYLMAFLVLKSIFIHRSLTSYEGRKLQLLIFHKSSPDFSPSFCLSLRYTFRNKIHRIRLTVDLPDSWILTWSRT